MKVSNYIRTIFAFVLLYIISAASVFAQPAIDRNLIDKGMFYPSQRNENRIIQKESQMPFYYSKAKIKIIRKSPTKELTSPMPWQPPETVVEIPELVFNVEVREGNSLYKQSGWFNLGKHQDDSGIMLAFSEPVIKPIIPSAQYAPTDILFIDKQGTITQMIPNIMLSDLEEDIYPEKPILAFLFLKGGICKKLSINVGDEVKYSIFKKPPLILNSSGNNSANRKNTLEYDAKPAEKVKPMLE